MMARLSSARRGQIVDVVMPTLTFVALLLVWQLVSVQFKLPVWLLPSPGRVWTAARDWSDQLPRHTFVTMIEAFAGFALAVAFGVPIGLLIAVSQLLKKTIYPFLILLQSVPKVAVAPLLLIWMGYGFMPKLAVVFLVCFFPIVVALNSGIDQTPPSLLDLARTLKASKRKVFFSIQLPYSLPFLFVGLKVAITLALIGAVIGEFVGSTEGLGYLILISSTQVNTSLAFVAMAILTVLSIALYYAIEWLERAIVPWATKTRI